MTGFNTTHHNAKTFSQLIQFRKGRFTLNSIGTASLFMPAIFASLLCSSTVQAAPTTPTGVRIDVYSDTALEVFWDRADTNARVSGYELNKNGNRLWLGDVTSYFDTELSPGTTNNYTIVAVDENGGRSDNSRVVSISDSCATSNGSCTSVSFSESQPSNGAGANGVGAIDGVALSIYSNSAAELFWQKNTGVSSYDVYRDETYLQRTDGSSFFDSSRQPGYEHHYKIVAIGVGGNQLGAVMISDNGVVSDLQGGNSSSSTSSNSGTGSSFSSSSSSVSDGSFGNNEHDSQSSSISASVYSASAGEIFWDANAGGDAEYEIYRNGHWIATTNGRSYYDAGLAQSGHYEYTIFRSQNGKSRLLGSATIVTRD